MSLIMIRDCILHNQVYNQNTNVQCKQARKPRSYASPKLRPTDLPTYLLTGVKCRATSVAKKLLLLLAPFKRRYSLLLSTHSTMVLRSSNYMFENYKDPQRTFQILKCLHYWCGVDSIVVSLFTNCEQGDGNAIQSGVLKNVLRTIVHIETKMLITCHFRTKGMRNKTSFYCQPLS